MTFEYLPRPIDFISNCPAQSNVRTTACRVCDIACDAWMGRAVAVTQVDGCVGYGSEASRLDSGSSGLGAAVELARRYAEVREWSTAAFWRANVVLLLAEMDDDDGGAEAMLMCATECHHAVRDSRRGTGAIRGDGGATTLFSCVSWRACGLELALGPALRQLLLRPGVRRHR